MTDSERTQEIRSMFHDINNSLTTVLGAAQLIIAESGPDSQAGKDAKDIEQAALEGRDFVARLRATILPE